MTEEQVIMLAESIRQSFISPNEEDRNGEWSCVTDSIFELSRAVRAITDSRAGIMALALHGLLSGVRVPWSRLGDGWTPLELVKFADAIAEEWLRMRRERNK
jgi:hypothetical protein